MLSNNSGLLSSFFCLSIKLHVRIWLISDHHFVSLVVILFLIYCCASFTWFRWECLRKVTKFRDKMPKLDVEFEALHRPVLHITHQTMGRWKMPNNGVTLTEYKAQTCSSIFFVRTSVNGTKVNRCWVSLSTNLMERNGISFRVWDLVSCRPNQTS